MKHYINKEKLEKIKSQHDNELVRACLINILSCLESEEDFCPHGIEHESCNVCYQDELQEQMEEQKEKTNWDKDKLVHDSGGEIKKCEQSSSEEECEHGVNLSTTMCGSCSDVIVNNPTP